MRPMLMMLALIGLLSLAILSAAQAAQPQNTNNLSVEERFRLLDRDRNGALSLQEFPNPEIFKRFDTNGDGLISMAEWKVGMGEKPQQPAVGNTLEAKFKLLDRDGNGKLSPQEFGDPALFAKVDANHDGFITFEELNAYANPGQQPYKPEKPQNLSLEQQFKLADKDGDGKLTPQEFNNPALFTKVDANGDGVITWNELKAYFDAGGQTQPKADQTLEQQFKAADKNGDGKLSPAEFPNPELFKKLDTNGDGFVSWDEAKAGVGPNANKAAAGISEQQFKTLDKNGDGNLTPDELIDAALFKKLDANGDGTISWDEAKAASPKPPTAPGDAGKPQGKSAEDYFKELDKNGDGKVTPDEMANAELFKKVDANNDGVVTLEEMKAYKPQPKATEPPKQTEPTLEERYKQLDKNGDGKLTPDELPYPELFKKLDADGDGSVTLDEAKAYAARPTTAVKPQGDGNKTPGTTPPTVDPAEQWFKQHDANGDGKLTPDELNKPELFKYLDKNADGAVTLDEVRAGWKAIERGTGSGAGNNPTATPQATLEQQFKAADKDGDGKLSPAELPDKELFARLDTNKDGIVTWDEAKVLLQAKTTDGNKPAGTVKPPETPAPNTSAKPGDNKALTLEQWFKQKDKNGDGKLTAGEIPYDNFFKLVDVNGDGAITLDELRGYAQAMANQ